MEKERVYWIDIYKAFAIILVVVGHATGRFNDLIYQFHVAAFFFISGWVSKQDAERFGRNVYKKFMSLMVPLTFAVVVSGIFIQLLQISGLYGVFYEAGTEQSFSSVLKNFLKHGHTIDLLGITWFIQTLFLASILSHFLWILSKRRDGLFFAATVLVYLLGCWAVSAGRGAVWNLAAVAQGYYGAAFVIKRITKDIKLKLGFRQKFLIEIFAFFLTFIIMIWLRNDVQENSLMNLANGTIHHVFWSTVAVANGISALYFASKFVSYLHLKPLKMALLAIGQNSMAIMLLHLACFRVFFCCLYAVGAAGPEEMRNLVPSAEIGDRYWFLFVLFSIVFSLLLWKILGKIPVVSQLLGIDKSLAGIISNLEISRQIVCVVEQLQHVFVSGWKEFAANMRQTYPTKYLVKCFLAAIVALTSIILIGFLPDRAPNREPIDGAISVTFPYRSNAVKFEDGWLAQGENENYRWVQQSSEMSVWLGDQSTVVLTGYVPAGIDHMSNMKVYLNDALIHDMDIRAEEAISVEADFGDHKIAGENVIRIEFDGMRTPHLDDADQRSFSAMFTSISMQ